MEVEFDDPKLSKLFSSDRNLQREMGKPRASLLRRRLAELAIANSMDDLRGMLGNWHPLSADRHEEWSASLDQPYRLVVRPTPPVPRLADGGVDWRSVIGVTVVEVVNYH
ncbi:MAG: hypothetical protein ACYC3W_01825 [Candidatus Nanopelagicales bacterium]